MKTGIALAAGSALVLALAGCGSAARDTSSKKPSGTTSASSSTTSSGTESATPSPPPSAAGDEVDAFAIDAMCKSIDRALAKKITGPVVGRDISLKAGQTAPMTGAPVQGPTCIIEGGKGEVETSVFTVKLNVDRRKTLTPPGDCKLVQSPPWNKAFECSGGPILIRFGKDSVFTCYSAQAAASPHSVQLGRAVCDDLLEKIS